MEKMVRTVDERKLPKNDRYPGAQVTIDGEQGYIKTVLGGRARVDFNHPLAGDDLEYEYEYEILELVEDDEEKAKGLLGRYLPEVPEVRIEEDVDMGVQQVKKRSLFIEATPTMKMDQLWISSKQQIAQDIMSRLDIDQVVVEEVIDGSGGMMSSMGGDVEDESAVKGTGAGGDPIAAGIDADASTDAIVGEKAPADPEYTGAATQEGETGAHTEVAGDDTAAVRTRRQDSPEAERERVEIGTLSDRIGMTVRIEGEVVEVRQTGGPTIFELRDETGVIDCAAFVQAGVRAYPEVDVGDIVRLDGEVEHRRGDVQLKTNALTVLESEGADSVDDDAEEPAEGADDSNRH